MVDGEFTGPSFRDHAVVAWGLLVFTLHTALYPGPQPWMPPVRHTTATEVASLTVRMAPEPTDAMDPTTWSQFWNKPAQGKLLHWVQQQCVSQRDGAAQINAFLANHEAQYSLRFISKPAGLDIARLRYCLETYGPEEGMYVPHHTSLCILSYMHIARQLMAPFGSRAFHDLLAEGRTAHGASGTVTHFPLDDCRGQLADYITCVNIIHNIVSERTQMAHAMM